MSPLKPWQLLILAFPPIAIVVFVITIASWQLHAWGLNWIWAVLILLGVGWRVLLARWLRPALPGVVTDWWAAPMPESSPQPNVSVSSQDIDRVLATVLAESQGDLPLWEDWLTFWQRCQTLVNDIAHLYFPNQKYPLLHINIIQVYGLVRGTVDDLDRWLTQLSPLLNSLTVSQLYEIYEGYQQWSPWIRRAMWVSSWAYWLINPFSALANVASRKYSTEANQKLLANFAQLLREAALRILAQRAVALYGNPEPVELTVSSRSLMVEQQTLKEILSTTTTATIEANPLQILVVGRTGAGKSSLINGLFLEPLAAVDILPSTDRLQSYHWTLDIEQESYQALTLWDTPGYEQIQQPQVNQQVRQQVNQQVRQTVLDYGTQADLVLLVTPALDPALQMDVTFLADLRQQNPDLPILTIVSQVDRVRPVREWQPPYQWETGNRPKEVSIREAVHYRAQTLGAFSRLVLPIVTAGNDRPDWGMDDLALALVEMISPVQQMKLARFLKHQETRTFAAAQIIDRYSNQMATAQGLASLLKGPTLQLIARLCRGNPDWGMVLADQIPVEQLPGILGKLQMAYEILTLFQADRPVPKAFNVASTLLQLWPLLLKTPPTSDPALLQRHALIFGRALVDYAVNDLTLDQLSDRLQAPL